MRSAENIAGPDLLDAARWAQARAERGGLPGFRARQLADRLQAGMDGVQVRLRDLVRAGLVEEIRSTGVPVYRVSERVR
ncbi:hypothetical protein [Parafrankia sp. EUN1f]|uniref:hypothetical protein n=1 Tax=Parafrankia sp. EUN1f TaxID=102897 RepID=UPI0001C456CA|nr:hypothetical protein [Parafrankia sp. EUN1f]EFC78839.1 hypothetical protein FrEUN1fDRAFT_8044 [Parafrankia sp. EUN1f]